MDKRRACPTGAQLEQAILAGFFSPSGEDARQHVRGGLGVALPCFAFVKPVCALRQKHAPHPPPNPRQEGYSYFLNRLRLPEAAVTNSLMDLFAFPFGYLDGDRNVTRLPLRLHDLPQPSATWALMDADKLTVTFGSGMTNLPEGRVHGRVWNQLYFDGHVAPARDWQ